MKRLVSTFIALCYALIIQFFSSHDKLTVDCWISWLLFPSLVLFYSPRLIHITFTSHVPIKTMQILDSRYTASVVNITHAPWNINTGYYKNILHTSTLKHHLGHISQCIFSVLIHAALQLKVQLVYYSSTCKNDIKPIPSFHTAYCSLTSICISITGDNLTGKQ